VTDSESSNAHHQRKVELIDAVSMERLQKLIAIETAEKATAIVVSWGKWIVAAVAALLTVLGLSTYSDFHKKIDTLSAQATKKVQAQSSKVLEDVDSKAKNILSDIDKRTSDVQSHLNQLDADMTALRDKVAAEAASTMTFIAERRTLISSQLVVKVELSHRKIVDIKGATDLSSQTAARSEDQPPTGNEAVDKAYDALGVVLTFWKTVYGRESYDGKGSEVIAAVHYGEKFNNTFWNGREIVVGDGDGKLFKTFLDLKIIASEFAHAVVQYTAAFEYQDQAGALNTSISDVFAVMVEQWRLQQTVDQSSWLIGDDIFAASIKGVGLRSLKAPGSAYDDPLLGKDSQPSQMKNFVKTSEDNGGTHINSGIPNHAFYLAATKIGGFAWERAGKIWYEALLASSPKDDFQKFAKTTLTKSESLFGKSSKEWTAVRDAWREVGIDVGS
jgi:Zn-dependent metalloprotease